MLNEQDFTFTKPVKVKPPLELTPLFVTPNYDFISGWVKKQSFNSSTLTYRYVILTDSKFKYYSNSNKSIPSGIFDFNQLTTTIHSVEDRIFVLEFHSCPYQFVFQAEDSEARQKWLFALNTQILQCKQHDEIQRYIGNKPNFWRNEWISDFWFQNNASTGDLLMLRHKNFGSVLHRGLAKTNYDNLAMVLCYASGKISVFYATSEEGIIIYSWEEFITKNWMKKYDKIGYRQLSIDRSEDFLGKISDFIGKSIGKKLKFSKTSQTSRPKFLDGTEKHFFYSDLIISAYKDVNVLSSDWDPPKLHLTCLEKKKHLDLIDCSFGDLLLIDFDFI